MSGIREPEEQQVAVAELGEQLGPLRLHCPAAVRSVQQSLVRHGQLTAVAAYRGPTGQVELVDGFKRLQASRELGRTTLRVRLLELDGVAAKAAVVVLNQQGGLTELEEGWLVRSLHRDDGLTQPQIGQLLSRHKSWVCRRLMLVELLDAAVQADVRLGLLGARTAVVLARLPHGNQQALAALVARRGLTTKQTEQLVAALLAAADDAARQQLLDDWAAGRVALPGRGGPRPPRPASSPVLQLVADIGLLCRVAARVEARLLERPLAALGVEGATVVRTSLQGLGPVLDLLQQAVAHCRGGTETTR